MAASTEKCQYGKASDFCEYISEVCQPCFVEGKRLQSDRFCVDCKEHLCAKCSTHHRTLKATRNHVLVSTDDAKNAIPAPTKESVSLSSVNAISSSDTDGSSRTTVKVSSPSTASSSKSKQIQPGSRVRYRWGIGWVPGTVERYDSSMSRWLVRWDNGGIGNCSTDRLDIL